MSKSSTLKAFSRSDLDRKSHQGCVVCSKVTKLQSCVKCKAEMYCSEECQNADWKTHRILCKYWLTDAVQKPPFPGARRIIAFEEHEAVIRFTWVLLDTASRSIGGTMVQVEGEFLDLHRFGIETRPDHLLNSPRIYETEKWCKNFVRDNRPFDNVDLQYWYCDNALDKRVFKPNTAGEKYFPETKNGIQGSVWPGPLLVSRCSRKPEKMLNMHIRDFREAADFFIKFSRRSKKDFEIGVGILGDDEPYPGDALSALFLQGQSFSVGTKTIV